jgi:hypothetical protein
VEEGEIPFWWAEHGFDGFEIRERKSFLVFVLGKNSLVEPPIDQIGHQTAANITINPFLPAPLSSIHRG